MDPQQLKNWIMRIFSIQKPLKITVYNIVIIQYINIMSMFTALNFMWSISVLRNTVELD